MSKILKTEAIVLRSLNYRETSKIVTFYTKQHGKLAGMVKGARRKKSRFGSSLLPMSYVSIVFYDKEGREIQTISNCDLMKSFKHLSEDLLKMSVGLRIVELSDQVTQPGEKNVRLFNLIVNVLNGVNNAMEDPENFFIYFELRLAEALGFQASFTDCVFCKKVLQNIQKGRNYQYSIERGGLVCSAHPTGGFHVISPAVLETLRSINTSNQVEDILGLELTKPVQHGLQEFLWSYLKFHIEGLRPLKSVNIFSKILK